MNAANPHKPGQAATGHDLFGTFHAHVHVAVQLGVQIVSRIELSVPTQLDMSGNLSSNFRSEALAPPHFLDGITMRISALLPSSSSTP